MEADAFRNAISFGIRFTEASASRVFLRSFAPTGDDALLGIRGTVVVADEEILPRPALAELSIREIALSDGRLMEGDIALTVDYTTAPETLLQKVLLIDGVEWRVVKADTTDLGGKLMGTRFICRRRIRVD